MEDRTILYQIKKAKTDKNQMENLIESFRPLIRKYARKLFDMEREDAEQELIIAVIQGVLKITQYNSEGECVNYISNAVKFRFYELQKSCLRLQNTEVVYDNLEWKIQEIPFEDIDFKVDICNKLEKLKGIRRKIGELLLYGDSDTEIAEKLGISRQYVNRMKKQLFL